MRLSTDVDPSGVGSFQHFSLPLSSFSVVALVGTPPELPAQIDSGISGNTTDPATSWGFDAGNTLQIDNISYAVVPEPRVVALGALCVAALFLRRRR